MLIPKLTINSDHINSDQCGLKTWHGSFLLYFYFALFPSEPCITRKYTSWEIQSALIGFFFLYFLSKQQKNKNMMHIFDHFIIQSGKILAEGCRE